MNEHVKHLTNKIHNDVIINNNLIKCSKTGYKNEYKSGYKKVLCDNNNKCIICLDNIQKGTYERILKCEHHFHKKSASCLIQMI